MAIYNRRLNLLGIVLLVFLSIGATKDIVPRADGEGGIGDSVKNWDYGYIDNIYSDNIGIGTTITTYDINVGGGTASSIDGVDDILVKGDIEVNSDIYVDGYLYGDGSQLTGISGSGHGDGTNCLDDYFAKGTDASGNAQGCTLIDSTIYESADATIYKESDIALIQAYIDTNLTFSSTGLTDTADLLYETELDDMTELEAQISDDIYVDGEIALIRAYMTANCADITGDAGLCDGSDDGGAETNTLSTVTTGIADDQVPTGTAADTVVYKSVPDCNAADRALSYEDSTNTWGCTTGFAAGSGDSVSIDTVEVVDPDFQSGGDIDFVDNSNDVTANINDDVIVAGDFADADHGDVAWLANVATVQDLTCSDCIGGTEIAELVDADISDTLTASDLVAGGSVVSNSEVDDDITLTDITQITNRASTSLTDTADILYETELDDMAKLEAQVSDDIYVDGEIGLIQEYVDANLTFASTGLTDTADLLYEAELDDMTKLEAQISDDIYVDGEAPLLLAYMTDNCSTITGHADLCDGSDDGAAGGSEWFDNGTLVYLNEITDNVYFDGNLGIGTSAPVYDIDTLTLGNSKGDLRLQYDSEGDVELFDGADVGDADNGKIMYVHRKAAEGDSYFGFYIDQYRVGHFVDSGVDSIYFDSVGNYRINPNSNGHVYFFENAGVGDNNILRQSGYISNGSARRFISWKIDDVNDYFTLTKDGASLLGFDVQMPLVADSLTVDDLAECNTIDTSSGVLSCGTDEGWTALTDMVLTDTYIYVGNGSSDPVGVDMTGDVGITNTGVTTVANDSHDHSSAGSTVTIAAADIVDISANSDITADLEEEAHCDEHDGRSTTCATEVLNADEETYVFTAKIAFTDPVDTNDFFFHEAKRAATITGIYCKTLVGTVDLDVSLAGTDINDSDITCNTTGVLDESLAGDTSMAISDEMALVITSVASSPTYLYVQVNGLYDD